MNHNKLLVIIGPTASGKTRVALKIAKKFGGEIICADSRTIYRGLDIGTAKPDYDKPEKKIGSLLTSPTEQKEKIQKEELYQPHLVQGIPHFALDIITPDEQFSLADFQSLAKHLIKDIAARGKLPMLVGGTGLYIKSVVDGLEIPIGSTSEKIRTKLEKRTLVELVKQLESLDPEALPLVDLRNKRRVLRALEICITTGRAFSAQRQKRGSELDILEVGIEVPRLALYERINKRVDSMISDGLLAEVKQLAQTNSWDTPAMSGIGYKQIGMYLRGEVEFEEAVRLIKRDTRRYAKRQMTWFGADERIVWCAPGKIEQTVGTWLEKTV